MGLAPIGCNDYWMCPGNDGSGIGAGTGYHDNDGGGYIGGSGPEVPLPPFGGGNIPVGGGSTDIPVTPISAPPVTVITPPQPVSKDVPRTTSAKNAVSADTTADDSYLTYGVIIAGAAILALMFFSGKAKHEQPTNNTV